MKRSEPVAKTLCEDMFDHVHRGPFGKSKLEPLGYLLDGPAGVDTVIQEYQSSGGGGGEGGGGDTANDDNGDDDDYDEGGEDEEEEEEDDDSPPRSYTIIAQPRSGGTTHVDFVARLYGCTALNEMYHGSSNQTSENIRKALLLEEQTGKGFMVDPDVAARYAAKVSRRVDVAEI
jgi:hypothetical protein